MKHFKEIEITVYNGVRDTTGHRSTQFDFLHNVDYDRINRLRATADADERKRIKLSLPQATISGVFSPTRSAENLVSHSGLLATEFNGGKAHERAVSHIINHSKRRHPGVCAVGFETTFSPDPVGTLLGDSFQRKFVAKFYLEVRPVKVALAIESRNIKLSLLLVELLSNESRRGEDEAQLVDALQLLFQLLIGINGETRCSDSYMTARLDCLHQVVAEFGLYVVDELHRRVNRCRSH